MIPPPISIMMIPMPLAGVFKAHGVGIIEVENRAPPAWWSVCCRNRPAIACLRPVRSIRRVGSVSWVAPVIAVLPSSFYAVAWRYHLASARINLSALTALCAALCPGFTRFRLLKYAACLASSSERSNIRRRAFAALTGTLFCTGTLAG